MKSKTLFLDNNYYTIYEDGKVQNSKGRYLKLNKSTKGYLVFSTSNKQYLHHRIMAMAFIPNPENKPHINHINAIRDDNRLCNLEWCTPTENIKHSFKLGNRDKEKYLKNLQKGWEYRKNLKNKIGQWFITTYRK